MTDPVALSSSPPVELVAQQNAPQAASANFAPADTQMFARMMQGPEGALATQAGSASAPPSALRDAAMAVAAQFGGGTRSFEDIHRSMLRSVDLSDPLKTMFVMTDHAMEAQAMFTKLHLSTSLASAATSLFGTLLKNQQ